MNKTTNLPVNPTELLKKQLAEAEKRVGQGEGRRIKITIAGFQDPNGVVGPQLEVVVIDYTLVHSYFDKPYDSDNIVPPVCYANDRIFQALAPVKDSPSPQAENCAICEMNRYKSAPNGKGKACRNSRLLAVVPANDIDSAPLWTFSVAPTSISRWDAFVTELMGMNLTPMFAKTKVTFEVAGTYAKPVFEVLEPLSKSETASAIARLEEARDILDLYPDWSEA
jgi:hypothetical protein